MVVFKGWLISPAHLKKDYSTTAPCLTRRERRCNLIFKGAKNQLLNVTPLGFGLELRSALFMM